MVSVLLDGCGERFFRFDSELTDDLVTAGATLRVIMICGNANHIRRIDLQDDDLLDEPTAALIDYIMSEGAERIVEAGRTIQCVVFDFGGGTCDVSVLEITADNKTKQILMSQIAVSRYHRLGGGDLDAGIALVVAIYSALKKHSASPALLIL